MGAHFAAKSAGVDLQHAWANDLDANTCRTYIRNIQGASAATVHNADVRSLNFKNLTPIDGLAFGFPCNDFSLVGEQLGVEGNYGPLYTYGVKALNEFQPQWFFAENVGGLASANEGAAFIKILSELMTAGDRGYQVTPHLYKFEEYGVPQRRHRIVLVGLRNDIGRQFLPPSTDPFVAKDTSVRHALENPPILEHATNNELTRQSPTVVERLSHIKAGQNAFNSDLPEELRLNVRGAKISQIYRRLDPDEPSYTITGSGGGGTHVYHWSENRALTNRERARLQTFPDSFHFEGGKESVRKQIGMAVPVEGAKVIFEAIFKTLNNETYATTRPNLERYHTKAVELTSRLDFAES